MPEGYITKEETIKLQKKNSLMLGVDMKRKHHSSLDIHTLNWDYTNEQKKNTTPFYRADTTMLEYSGLVMYTMLQEILIRHLQNTKNLRRTKT
ncbi:MAG: hypothetical protein Q7J55_01700 [bacterium]|nr:hypothetical protein [bacterium]